MKDVIASTFPLGMGCWAIGGPYHHEQQSLGWGAVDDKESIDTMHAAYDHGVRIFDNAAVYGTGHSESVLDQAIHKRDGCIVATKIGLDFSANSKKLIGAVTDPSMVLPAIDASLKRLQRDSIDLLLLHLNDLPIAGASPLFQEMDKAYLQGKIQGFDWSTDYPASVDAYSGSR